MSEWLCGQCGERYLGNPDDHTCADKDPSILRQAQLAVADRQDRYGDCTEVFAATNEMFAIYKSLKKGGSDAHDTAIFNILQKVVRIGSGTPHRDNWVDIAGYADRGAEVSDG